jgi:hypothetical protein
MNYILRARLAPQTGGLITIEKVVYIFYKVGMRVDDYPVFGSVCETSCLEEGETISLVKDPVIVIDEQKIVEELGVNGWKIKK